MKSKKSFLFAVVPILLLGSWQPLKAANIEVKIQNYDFAPRQVTINVGDTITWRNLDLDIHTSTSGPAGQPDGLWDSGFLSQNQTFSHTFNTAGSFQYYCIPHTFMQGSVIVNSGSQPPVVTITSPANGTELNPPGPFTITANASAPGSSIVMVEFLDGTTSLGMDHDAPYSAVADLSTGPHRLTAIATTGAGVNVTSPPVNVIVNSTSQAPVVNITVPTNGSVLTLPGPFTIAAEASAPGASVVRVEFFDGAAAIGMDEESPFSIAANLAAGAHTLRAVAATTGGLNATSPPVNVTVNSGTESPVVTITAPANNSVLNPPGPFIITADASAPGGTIAMVEFFDGAAPLGMDSASPFSVSADLALGAHTLTAVAMTAGGINITSAPVNVTVGAQGTRIQNPYPPLAKGDTTIELETVAEGLVSPLGLAAPDDGSSRLFVFDQVGLVHVLANGTLLETPLLDVSSRLVQLASVYDERGLLGLATHPNFSEKPFIYTYTSEPNGAMADFMIMPDTGTNDHQSVIAEWKIDSANTNRVDPASRREILRLDKPQSNHNGGVIHFGPDGMLYIAIGDGGAADDEGEGHSPGGNGQDLNKVLGKIIRIDVDSRTSPNGQYGVPADNPFVGRDGLDEIYSYGFRNPYSWSFDRLSGEMYVGDVGQNDVEEVDRVFKGGNYGWPVKEGSFYFDAGGTNAGFITSVPVRTVPPDLIDPIADYDHSEGLAIVGGYVYHGEKIPGLIGRYVTGDFGTFAAPVGRLFYLDRSQLKELRIGNDDRKLGAYLKGFGQDQDGELYICVTTNLGPSGRDGRVLKIAEVPFDLAISISSTGTNSGISWTGGVGPFIVEKRDSLGAGAWTTFASTAQRTLTLSNLTQTTFFRIADLAGNGAIPFTVYMTGAAERPANNTTGTGSGTLSLEGNTLHFDIRYSGLTGPAILAHIHGLASAANSAPVMIDLAPYNGGGFGSNGVISGSITLTPDQKAAILSGKTYVNVHTDLNKGGEIRGQIAPLVFTADLTGGAERPEPVETAGAGSGVFMLVGNQLTFDLEYHGLSSAAILSHIHGATNEQGAASVMVDLQPLNGGSFGTNGTIGGTVTLTPDQLAALVDGLTYVNVHTDLHKSGEIRGQLKPNFAAIPLTASLSGAAERPAVTNTAGVGSGTFALLGDTLRFNIRYSGLSGAAILAHIHGPATAAVSAPVMINLAPFNGGAFGTNGTLSGSVLLTEKQRATILEGRTYVNIHTPANPSGEIRGQVLPSAMHAILSGAAERPASVQTKGSGRGTLLLVGNQLALNATYSGLSAPAILAHIHGATNTAAAAPVMVNLQDLNGGAFSTNGSFSGRVTLTPEQLAAIADSLTYMNVHTSNNTAGEIRGQITR